MEHADVYYTRVDNGYARDTGVAGGEKEYTYSLSAYDAEGAQRPVVFTARRLLREDACLELRILPIRGVVSWEEREYGGLPQKVREALAGKNGPPQG